MAPRYNSVSFHYTQLQNGLYSRPYLLSYPIANVLATRYQGQEKLPLEAERKPNGKVPRIISMPVLLIIRQ